MNDYINKFVEILFSDNCILKNRIGKVENVTQFDHHKPLGQKMLFAPIDEPSIYILLTDIKRIELCQPKPKINNLPSFVKIA